MIASPHRRWIFAPLALLAALGPVATPARADLVPTFAGTSDADGRHAGFHYDLAFDPAGGTQELVAGDSLAFRDVLEVILASGIPGAFDPLITIVSGMGGLGGTEDVTYTYVGPTVTTATTFPDVFFFAAYSPSGTVAWDSRVSSAADPAVKVDAAGTAALPVDPQSVPEPATWGMLAVGGLAVAGLAVRSRSRAARPRR
jgi:hypothetical protein